MRQRTYIGRIAFGKFRGKNLIFKIDNRYNRLALQTKGINIHRGYGDGRIVAQPHITIANIKAFYPVILHKISFFSRKLHLCFPAIQSLLGRSILITTSA